MRRNKMSGPSCSAFTTSSTPAPPSLSPYWSGFALVSLLACMFATLVSPAPRLISTRGSGFARTALFTDHVICCDDRGRGEWLHIRSYSDGHNTVGVGCCINQSASSLLVLVALLPAVLLRALFG
eukprot:m.50086 g.50086  ORF g.50086 m.50086 type:complete len:125 (+) comp13391_c0_seq4:125-499(+)